MYIHVFQTDQNLFNICCICVGFYEMCGVGRLWVSTSEAEVHGKHIIQLPPFLIYLLRDTKRFLYCRIGKSRGQSNRRAESSCNNWPHILL